MPALTSAEQRERALQRQAEEAARFKKLYGPYLEDVRLLQKCGFVVTKEGGSFLVGNKSVDGATLRAMAERERRLDKTKLSAGSRTTASGLKVGDSVPLAPKQPVVRASAPAPRPQTSPKVAVITEKPRQRAGTAAVPFTGPRGNQHSTDLGKRPKVVWLGLELLTVDRRYQREIGEGGRTHINRITQAFNWNCYQPIIVTESQEGRYAVIDGQHRLEAARKHPLIDSLPCYVIDAPEVASQAAIFVAVNSVRKGLTSAEKFWASHAAGEPAATALAEICSKAGVKILRGPPGGIVPAMSLLGPLVAQRLVARFGPGPVREAITLLAETNAKTPGAFRSSTISALARIAADKDYSRDRMRARLAATDLDQMHGEASGLAKGGGVGSLTLAAEKILRRAA